MAETIKIRRVGNSLGLILPQHLVESLDVRLGDEVFVIKTPDGIRLTPYDPEFATAVEDAREFMRTHRNAFKRLAE